MGYPSLHAVALKKIQVCLDQVRERVLTLVLLELVVKKPRVIVRQSPARPRLMKIFPLEVLVGEPAAELLDPRRRRGEFKRQVGVSWWVRQAI